MDSPQFEAHPSFGVITLNRVTHGSGLGSPSKFEGTPLFGSSILHHTTIRLEISQASLKRDLNRDWILPTKSLIEVEMSSSQFAEAITSFGVGEGVPVTIVNLNGKRIPETSFTSKRVQFDSEFENDLEKIASKLNPVYTEIERILAKPNLGKHDREEIRKQLRFLNQSIASNLPFVKKQFSEQMDATVLEAKNEIETFIEEKLRKIGLEGFKKELTAYVQTERKLIES